MFCQVAGALQQKSLEVNEDEKDIAEDVLVMREIRKIADTVMTMLKTEEDSPGNHPELGFKVPILDEAMWVENVMVYSQGQDVHSKCNKDVPCLPIKEPECEDGVEGEVRPAPRMAQQIYYEFFTKPMKPKLVISAESALPWQQKRTVLTQECIRRLLNTKKELNCGKKQAILSSYMQALKNSGYSTQFRKEILDSGLKGYNKILAADKKGERPMYRLKEWRKAARWLEGKKKKVLAR